MYKSILFHVSDQELIPTQSKYSNISDIDKYDDNSIDNILYQDICDYFLSTDVYSLLQKAYDKLSSGGTFHIQGSDLKQLCIANTFNMVDENIIKNILYPHKKSIHTLGEILDMMKQIGFDIQHKKYINIFEYYIKASKP